MQDDSIKSHRVEVLGDNVQKYASSSVSGGGGYVTSANGVTYGQTQAVTTTISHHVDQDIWVKDLTSGKEMQINIVDDAFPVRPGHILRVVYDKKTERWERLVNETTGHSTYGNGKVNPGAEKRFLTEGKTGPLWAIALIVPFVNWLAGPALLLQLLVAAPTSIYGVKIPGAMSRVMTALLAGVGIFVLAFLGLYALFEHKFFLKLVAAIGLGICFLYFTKSFRSIFQSAAEMVKARSDLLDQSVSSTAFE